MCAKLSVNIAFLSKEKNSVKMEIRLCMNYSDFKEFMGWFI